jgi:hypothetical protein
VIVAAALAGAGCSSSSPGAASASARAAASSLAANPAYQQDKAKLEAQLLANLKKDFTAAHPYASAKKAMQDTFPSGDGKKIVNYGVHTFTLKAAKKGPAQTAWIDGIATYALAQGAQGVGKGQPSIPGVTSSATPHITVPVPTPPAAKSSS